MKNKLIIIFAFLALSNFAQKTCPPEGVGRNDKEKELNIEKNRSCIISADAQIDIN